MRILKITISFIVTYFILGQQNVNAQYYWYGYGYGESDVTVELGLSGGIMNGMTDIGGSKKGKANAGFLNDFTTKNTKLNAGVYLSATYRDVIAGRIEANFGNIEATDSSLKGTKNAHALGRFDRNLSFKTSIFNANAIMEFHPLFLKDYTDYDPPRFSPYVLAGVGVTKFNPKANLNGNWYDLRPLRLEGQGFEEYPDRQEYKTSTFTLPFGVGLRYDLGPLVNLRVELVRYWTNTDYLDDAHYGDWVDPALFYKYLTPGSAAIATQLYNRSTTINPPRNTRPRANEKDNDTFWTFNIKIGYKFNRRM